MYITYTYTYIKNYITCIQYEMKIFKNEMNQRIPECSVVSYVTDKSQLMRCVDTPRADKQVWIFAGATDAGCTY